MESTENRVPGKGPYGQPYGCSQANGTGPAQLGWEVLNPAHWWLMI